LNREQQVSPLLSALVAVAAGGSQAVRTPQFGWPRVASAKLHALKKATGGGLGCSARNLALRAGSSRSLEPALERQLASSEGLD